MAKQPFLLTIVVPVYNEEDNINTLLSTLLPLVQKYRFELIFVDDGSSDSTSQLISNHTAQDKRIKLIRFVRNFGHQYALSAGYAATQGDCVITIDADLQDPPELIPTMIKLWQGGSKIVYAKRTERNESFFKKHTAGMFYRLIKNLSEIPIPENVGDFRLLDKEVVDFLNTLPEKSRFLRGLVAWGGYTSSYVHFTRHERKKGKTHYPLSKMLKLALDGITSFSTRPLQIAMYAGFISASLGIAGIIYGLIQRLFLPSFYWVTGWTALFVAIMFFGGVQLITIGICGEYIGKIYKELQGRPMYLIKETINIEQ